MIEIVAAQTGEPFGHFITLAQEYVTWMSAEIRQQYPGLNLYEFVSDHAYDDLRKKFPGIHVPPDGCLLIALNEGQPCGCVALGRLTDTICEMRTVYVRPDCRGLGVGKKLVEAIIGKAGEFGYHTMRLDTLRFMQSAQSLYYTFGFYNIEPYVDIAADLEQYVCFLEYDLAH
jgi:N-acetylglutamate synthase-like GNAT family acetyltransferase